MPFPEIDDARVPWISVPEMREVDRIAIELGVDLPRMMENAGRNLAVVPRELLGGDAAGRRVAVLAGGGGNGGGGLVAARHLAGAGGTSTWCSRRRPSGSLRSRASSTRSSGAWASRRPARA